MEIIITLVINMLSQYMKKHIAPKYGETGMQVTVFLISLAVAAGYLAYEHVPNFKDIVMYGVSFFTLAVTIYEVILKKLKFVKTSEQVEIEV